MAGKLVIRGDVATFRVQFVDSGDGNFPELLADAPAADRDRSQTVLEELREALETDAGKLLDAPSATFSTPTQDHVDDTVAISAPLRVTELPMEAAALPGTLDRLSRRFEIRSRDALVAWLGRPVGTYRSVVEARDGLLEASAADADAADGGRSDVLTGDLTAYALLATGVLLVIGVLVIAGVKLLGT